MIFTNFELESVILLTSIKCHYIHVNEYVYLFEVKLMSNDLILYDTFMTTLHHCIFVLFPIA